MKNIVLTGFMGVGKTEVGLILAHKLRWKFYDTDLLIQNRMEMSIDKIISKYGEPYFRKAEADVFAEIIYK